MNNYVFIVALVAVIGLGSIPFLMWRKMRHSRMPLEKAMKLRQSRMTLGQAWPGSRAWKWDSVASGHFQLYCYADVILWKDKGFRLWIGDKDQGRLYRWTLPRVLWLWWKLR
jgi:hypothetical protein